MSSDTVDDLGAARDFTSEGLSFFIPVLPSLVGVSDLKLPLTKTLGGIGDELFGASSFFTSGFGGVDLETAEGNGGGTGVDFLSSLGNSTIFSSLETVSSGATLSLVESVTEGIVGIELIGFELSFFSSADDDENLVSKGIFTSDALSSRVLNDSCELTLMSSVGGVAFGAEVFVVAAAAAAADVLFWLDDDRDEYENSGLVVIVLEVSVIFLEADTSSSSFFEVTKGGDDDLVGTVKLGGDDFTLPNDGAEDVGLVEVTFVGFEVEGTPKLEAGGFVVVADAVVVLLLLVAVNLATFDGGNGEPEKLGFVVEGTPNEEVVVVEVAAVLLPVVVTFDLGKGGVPNLGGPLKSGTGLAGDGVVLLLVVLVTSGFIPNGLVEVLAAGGTPKELVGFELVGFEKLLEVELFGGTPNVLLVGLVKLLEKVELFGGTPNVPLVGLGKLLDVELLVPKGLPELFGGTPNEVVAGFVKLLEDDEVEGNGVVELFGGTPKELVGFGLVEPLSLSSSFEDVAVVDGNGLLVVIGGGTPNVLAFGFEESSFSFLEVGVDANGLLVVLGGTLNDEGGGELLLLLLL